MPYIKQGKREEINPDIDNLSKHINHVGDLNYTITKLCRAYLKHATTSNYQGYNDIIGVLECAKLEFYRRAVSIYEDEKIKENGDVY